MGFGLEVWKFDSMRRGFFFKVCRGLGLVLRFEGLETARDESLSFVEFKF